jgi:hypothetical protein
MSSRGHSHKQPGFHIGECNTVLKLHSSQRGMSLKEINKICCAVFTKNLNLNDIISYYHIMPTFIF